MVLLYLAPGLLVIAVAAAAAAALGRRRRRLVGQFLAVQVLDYRGVERVAGAERVDDLRGRERRRLDYRAVGGARHRPSVGPGAEYRGSATGHDRVDIGSIGFWRVGAYLRLFSEANCRGDIFEALVPRTKKKKAGMKNPKGGNREWGRHQSQSFRKMLLWFRFSDCPCTIRCFFGILGTKSGRMLDTALIFIYNRSPTYHGPIYDSFGFTTNFLSNENTKKFTLTQRQSPRPWVWKDLKKYLTLLDMASHVTIGHSK